MGEQPNPWDLLQPQDAMSRHRCRLLLLPKALTIPSSFQSRKELAFYKSYKFALITLSINFYLHYIHVTERRSSRYGRLKDDLGIALRQMADRGSPILASKFLF